jgi:hypothetical protein
MTDPSPWLFFIIIIFLWLAFVVLFAALDVAQWVIKRLRKRGRR